MLLRLSLATLLSVALVFSALVVAPPQPAAAADCEFVLGFKALHDMIPDKVGDCKTNEYHNPDNGDGLQETNGGLLVWRKADNWTAFTDGYHTWLNGPQGLQMRLNTERFPWESSIADAKEFVLTLADLPAGFGPMTDQTGYQQVSGEPGLVSQYMAGYTRSGVEILQSTAVVASVAAVYGDADSAHNSMTVGMVMLGGADQNWQKIDAPTIGDETIAYRAEQEVGEGEFKTKMVLWLIGFRDGKVVGAVATGGVENVTPFEEAVNYARLMESRIPKN